MTRARRHLGAIAIALGVVAVSVAPARAACPPLKGGGTWLEQLARQNQGRATPRENFAPFSVTPAHGRRRSPWG